MTAPTRRMFLGSAAVAGAGAMMTFPVVPGFAQDDAVGGELRRQLEATLRLMGRNRTGEGPRRIGGLLRLMVAHHRQLDSEIRARGRRIVRERGREAVLAADVDLHEVMALAERLGLRFPLTPRSPSRQVREQVLDELLSKGITAHWLRAADAFDKLSELLDQQAGAIRPVIYDAEACRTMTIMLEGYAATAAVACLFGPNFVCAAATGAYLGHLAAMWYVGC